MAKHIFLKAAAKNLNAQKLHLSWIDDNLIEVSENKNSKVFAFLVIEEKQFHGIVVSFALDFYDVYRTADLVISLMHTCPVALGEAFYRSNDGELHWSEDATSYFTLEHDNKLLKDLIPPNKSLH